MTRRDQQEREASSSMSANLTYLIIGGTIGAAVALLFAPKAGRELRSDIADVTRRGVDRTRETASQIGTKAGEYYETASSRAGELAGAARDAATRRGEHLSAAIEAGRRAYQEEKRRTESTMLQPAPTYYEDENRS